MMNTVRINLSGIVGYSAYPTNLKRKSKWFTMILELLRERSRKLRDYDRLMDMPEHLLRDVGLDHHHVAIERKKIRNQLFWN